MLHFLTHSTGPCNSLIEAKLQGCQQAPCVLDGGSRVQLEIKFRSEDLISGKAKMCLTHLSRTSCDPDVAGIYNICDQIQNGCTRTRPGPYTYNTEVSVPDVQFNFNATYKLYNSQCALVACVHFPISVRSTNRDPSNIRRVGNDIPCPE
ncbi:unnamed protein product [Dicrocoelium dendriticum]|nr:unnamed protein product [Dicrocoelium dendriticum]